MARNQNNINEIRESLDYFLKRNHEVQNDVKIAISLEDYLKAVKAINDFVKEVNKWMENTLTMSLKYRNKYNYEKQCLCQKVLETAKNIITAHIEVEKNIVKKFIKKIK
jgi:hypothetical protein